MTAQVVQMENTMQQRFAAQSTPVPAETMGLLGSPEFRGGMILALSLIHIW